MHILCIKHNFTSDHTIIDTYPYVQRMSECIILLILDLNNNVHVYGANTMHT